MRTVIGCYLTALILVTVITLGIGLFPQVSAEEQKRFYIYVEPLPDYARSYASNVIYEMTRAYETTNPNIKFYLVSTEKQPHDFRVQWLKDSYGSTFTGEAFIAEGTMQVSLGDSYCRREWQPYSFPTVVRLAEHELGHLLGFQHSTDPSHVMYATPSYFQYGKMKFEQSVPSGSVLFFPACTLKDTTSFAYSVTTTEKLFGVDVYFVPSINEFQKYASGKKDFLRYTDNGCFSKGKMNYYGKCNVSRGSGLLISVPPLVVNAFQTITVELVETSLPASYFIPTLPAQKSSMQSTPIPKGPSIPQPPQVVPPQSPTPSNYKLKTNTYLLVNGKNSVALRSGDTACVYVRVTAMENGRQVGIPYANVELKSYTIDRYGKLSDQLPSVKIQTNNDGTHTECGIIPTNTVNQITFVGQASFLGDSKYGASQSGFISITYYP